jgi:hypothetical protein
MAACQHADEDDGMPHRLPILDATPIADPARQNRLGKRAKNVALPYGREVE